MKLLNPAAAIAVTAMISLSQHANAHELRPPAVPAGLEVPAGNFVFLKGEATGTQNYVCTPSGNAFAWVLFTPENTSLVLVNEEEVY